MQTLKVVRHGRVRQSAAAYTSPTSIVNLVAPSMRRLDREHLVVLHLDAGKRIIAKETVSIGTLTETFACAREVFRGAIINGSHAIILVHNHPFGDSAPSTADIDTTHRLRDAGKLLGVDLLDHIIIGGDDYWSFEASAAQLAERIRTSKGFNIVTGGRK